MHILNVTSIIRNDIVHSKKTENTILFDIDKLFSKSSYNTSFSYLYLHPYSNNILGKISKKWDQYSVLSKLTGFYTHNLYIDTLPLFILPFKTKYNRLLFKISTYIFRRRIDNVIKKCKPSLVQALDVDKSAHVARYIAKKYNIPFIVYSREINQPLFKYIKSNLNDASCIISHGYMHYNIAKQHFGGKPNFLIPHGVGKCFFSNSISPFDKLEKIKIISVGRLLKLKNFDVLINAVSKFELFSLDIYGDGEEKDFLLSLIEKLHVSDRVRIITQPFKNEDLPIIFNNYNLFALISYPETFGRVYAEAVVCGLPILGAKESGIYGQLIEKSNGFFINPKDEKELYNLFELLTRDTSVLETIRKNNLDIRMSFSWDNILLTYYNLYQSLIQKSADEK